MSTKERIRWHIPHSVLCMPIKAKSEMAVQTIEAPNKQNDKPNKNSETEKQQSATLRTMHMEISAICETLKNYIFMGSRKHGFLPRDNTRVT